MLICTIIMAVTVAIHIAMSREHISFLSGTMKMAGSCAFMGVAYMGGALESTYGWLILAGLFFSWWGDLLLIFKQNTIFLLGVLAFFLAHVAYVAAFVVIGVDWMWFGGALVVCLGPLVIILRWLSPTLEDMRYPVYAYIVVITLMVAMSVGALGAGSSIWMPIGAVMFYISDIFVARDRFASPGYVNRVVGLPLYYGGQVVFAFTVSTVL